MLSHFAKRCVLMFSCASLLACATPAASPTSAALAPTGAEDMAAEWIGIRHNDHTILAAVARPDGRGPFPVVVVMHGSHGFAREYVRLAHDLSRGGVIAVAPCWFAGGVGEGRRFVTPVACPDAPPNTGPGDSPEAREIVHSIVKAVRNLDGASPRRVGLFGHSRGGGASLHYVLTYDDVEAVAANSAGYPPELTRRAHEITARILILHGEADRPAEGGSPMTNVRMARAFEGALRSAGKPVEAVYYDGNHNALFANPEQYADEVARLREFFGRRER
jgi:dienelactone hydrolase